MPPNAIIKLAVPGSPGSSIAALLNCSISECKSRLHVILRRLCDNHATWRMLQERGQKCCEAIEKIKARCILHTKGEECADGPTEGTLYPNKLVEPCYELQNIFLQLFSIGRSASIACKQVTAMIKLIGFSDHVMFRTWLIEDVMRLLHVIKERYLNELQTKKHVMGELTALVNAFIQVSHLIEWNSLYFNRKFGPLLVLP